MQLNYVYMQLIGYVKLFYMHVVHRGKASQKYATALCGLLQVWILAHLNCFSDNVSSVACPSI